MLVRGEPAVREARSGRSVRVRLRMPSAILATHNGRMAIRQPTEDLYGELGVGRSATRDEIAAGVPVSPGSCTRCPPGDAAADERFKRVTWPTAC